MIVLKGVTKTYQLKNQAVDAVIDVNLKVEPGEFVVVTGRSGSGKTTLLNLVAGMVRPTQGEVWVDGVEIEKLNDRQQARFRNQKIGFVFQFASLMPTLTVLENVLLPTIFGSHPQKQAARQRGLALLEEVGLREKLEAFPNQLSAGQQQRVVITRALINQPEVLLADEPTSNLDEQTEREIMSLIKELHARTAITVMLVTHSAGLASYGTRSIEMNAGRV